MRVSARTPSHHILIWSACQGGISRLQPQNKFYLAPNLMWCTDETFGINLSRKTSRYFLLSLYLFWTGALVAMVRHYRQPTEKNLLVNGSRVLIGLLDWVFVSEEIWSWEATYDSLIATDPSEAGEVFVKSWKVRNQMKPKNIVRVKTLISSQESGFWRGGETDLSNNVTKRKYNSNKKI